jgi:NTE family protein
MERLEIQSEYQKELLLTGLKHFFGDIDEKLLLRVLPRLEWVEVGSGEVIFRQGSPGRDLYFVVSGRLRATVDDGPGGERVLGEVLRGESVGEMSVVTGAPRMATITAVRSSVLVRFSRRQFQKLLNEFPRIALRLMHLLIERLSRSGNIKSTRRRPENIALLPISAGVDAEELAVQLALRLQRYGRTKILTPSMAAEMFGSIAMHAAREQMAEYLAVTRKLDELEGQHDFVLYVASPEDCGWTRRCLNYADEVVLLAAANDPPVLHPIETALAVKDRGISSAGRRLVLIHEAGCLSPSLTSHWLDTRELIGHVHLRRGHVQDLDRLARIVSGNAVGLVMSGGGARGFAHLGVYRALVEAGIPVDYVGGTSMGAVIASLVALDIPPRDAIDNFREVFRVRPLSDFNAFPIVSLISGKRLEKLLDTAYRRLIGGSRNVEDCWKNFYCIASSYSFAREVVIHRGPLLKMLRASLSIPGFFPPVFHAGEALVDGAIFNNFPTDEMARIGVGRMIGVDLGDDNFGPVVGDEFPGVWTLLRHWLGRRRDATRVPLLGGMLFRAPMLYSKSRQTHAAEIVDVLIKPDLRSIGMLDWNTLDQVVDIAYRHTQAQLESEKSALCMSKPEARAADSTH